jgi:hypothetical protein
VREDIAQSFTPGGGEEEGAGAPGADYLAMLNTSDVSPAIAEVVESSAPAPVNVKAPGKRGPKAKGVVDSGKKEGKPAGRRGRPSKNEDGGLKEL